MIENNPTFQPPELNAVMQHFNRILEIPRPSGGEIQIRQHIVGIVEEKGLEYKIDAKGNLSIDVPAKPGCEDKKRVILQGHMDMVTIGGNDANATTAYLEDGWLSTKEQTTLGADNGLGVAMALALLDDEESQHGPLTLLFTVDEETGLTGVTNLTPNLLPNDREIVLINLDSEEGVEYVCKGCAGGVDVVGRMNITETAVPEGFEVLDIELDGLLGGHSGIDIHLERGNAIQMLNKLLIDLSSELQGKDADLVLIDISGGSKRNVIPSNAKCRIAVRADLVSFAKKYLQGEIRRIKKNGDDKLRISRKSAAQLSGHGVCLLLIQAWRFLLGKTTGINLNVEKVSLGNTVQAFSEEFRRKIQMVIAEICTLEIVADKGEFKGGVKLSNNLGVLKRNGDVVELVTMVRGAVAERMDDRAAQIGGFLERQDAAAVKTRSRYEGWLEDEDSPAVQVAVDAVREVMGREQGVFAYHAGLESAYVRDLVRRTSPGTSISAVSIGPHIVDAHSVKERVRIDSVKDTYAVLKVALAKLAA